MTDSGQVHAPVVIVIRPPFRNRISVADAGSIRPAKTVPVGLAVARLAQRQNKQRKAEGPFVIVDSMHGIGVPVNRLENSTHAA